MAGLLHLHHVKTPAKPLTWQHKTGSDYHHGLSDDGMFVFNVSYYTTGRYELVFAGGFPAGKQPAWYHHEGVLGHFRSVEEAKAYADKIWKEYF